jgi:hypothetical protein
LVPAKHYLDSLRALRGAPKVTYPYGGTSYPRLERVYSVPKGRVDDIPTTLTDFPGSLLVEVVELARDHNDVEVYLVYATLPGPMLTTQEQDAETQSPVIISSQQVAKPAFPLSKALGTATGSGTTLTLAGHRLVDGMYVLVAGVGAWVVSSNISAGTFGAAATPGGSAQSYSGAKSIAFSIGTSVSYAPINDLYGNITFATLLNFASLSVVDYPTGQYTAPPLLYGVTANDQSAWDGSVNIALVYSRRPALTQDVAFTRTKTYNSASALLSSRPTLENPPTADIILDNQFFPPVRQLGVLCDTQNSISFTTGTENPKWPYMVETIGWAATALSATAYPGRQVHIDAPIELWKYDLSRMTTVGLTTF